MAWLCPSWLSLETLSWISSWGKIYKKWNKWATKTTTPQLLSGLYHCTIHWGWPVKTHSLMSKPLKCRSPSIQYLDQNVMRKAHGDKCVVVGQRSATATLMSRFLCHVACVCTGSWGLHVEETHTAFLMRNTGKKNPPKQTYHQTKEKLQHILLVSRLKRYLVWKVTRCM